MVGDRRENEIDSDRWRGVLKAEKMHKNVEKQIKVVVKCWLLLVELVLPSMSGWLDPVSGGLRRP